MNEEPVRSEDHPDRYASRQLLDGLKAAIRCESDPQARLEFLVGYIATYDPDIEAECMAVLNSAARVG